jgi:hypothetical protein
MRFQRIFAISMTLIAAAFVAAGCGGVPKDSICTVGGESITKERYNALLAKITPRCRSKPWRT